MPPRPLAVVILAAGQGKRFRSSLPKVLHPVAGLPIVHHVLGSIERLEGVERVLLVVGHEKDALVESIAPRWPSTIFVDQPERLGTADAVRRCEPFLADFHGDVLVVNGDHPLVRTTTLAAAAHEHGAEEAAVTLVTAHLDNPTGYGRIVRDERGALARIVEEADANETERSVREVSVGIWCFDREALFRALPAVGSDNAQGERYLPDAAMLIREQGGRFHTVAARDPWEIMGVNDRVQLSEAARQLRLRRLHELMVDGVTIEDPATTYVDEAVEVGPDTVLLPMTFLGGSTRIGRGCTIGPSTRIVDSVVEDGAEITFSQVLSSHIGPRARVGPFGSLRPGTRLEAEARVGTFVEVKGSTIGEGSKVPHLSYVGDAEIGREVNVGAGTITCNYDGEAHVKSKTVIEDGALIGSDTMLVAPVVVGEQAVTGAGSVVTRDIAPGDVVVGSPARRTRRRRGHGESAEQTT
ncbi:MAG: bifunctional UDP-N-acetylglucosamine diphosphorylase/glucosamine-1-phosphate N-acetyltransferase GlmU [Actinomycetota bacterium]